MIDVILYDSTSIIRIAQRAVEYFSNYDGFRTTKDVIWLKGMYIKFAPDMLVLNVFDSNVFSDDNIIDCLRNVLSGEEVYVSDNYHFQKYIAKVDLLTDFKDTLQGSCL